MLAAVEPVVVVVAEPQVPRTGGGGFFLVCGSFRQQLQVGVRVPSCGGANFEDRLYCGSRLTGASGGYSGGRGVVDERRLGSPGVATSPDLSRYACARCVYGVPRVE